MNEQFHNYVANIIILRHITALLVVCSSNFIKTGAFRNWAKQGEQRFRSRLVQFVDILSAAITVLRVKRIKTVYINNNKETIRGKMATKKKMSKS